VHVSGRSAGGCLAAAAAEAVVVAAGVCCRAPALLPLPLLHLPPLPLPLLLPVSLHPRPLPLPANCPAGLPTLAGRSCVRAMRCRLCPAATRTASTRLAWSPGWQSTTAAPRAGERARWLACMGCWVGTGCCVDWRETEACSCGSGGSAFCVTFQLPAGCPFDVYAPPRPTTPNCIIIMAGPILQA